MAETLYDKIWNLHKIEEDLIYIDRQLLHEVTSPQAFESIKLSGRKVKNPKQNLAVVDHNIPTDGSWRNGGIRDPMSKAQVDELEKNAKENNIQYYSLGHENQGIVHVVGPELGFTQPGTTVVCGDSHTSTHGAFGALAFGIGTSEVEHVLVTQTLRQKKSGNFLVKADGTLGDRVLSKDIVMAIIGYIGTAGGTGYVVEYSGTAIRNCSMEARMTICNMSIEAGARAGLIAVDDTTIEYMKNRKFGPSKDQFETAANHWRQFKTDEGAKFDKTSSIDASTLEPQITWGTSPEDVAGISEKIPTAERYKSSSDQSRVSSFRRSLEYMGLQEGGTIQGTKVDKVFIGSCTNSRIEDLRIAASMAKGRKVSSSLKLAMVVPGSGLVKKQAEEEGLDKVFLEAGFQWREPGCSMCLAMNNDKLEPQERCVSTSNRNFEGRQGRGGRTHLASPLTAVAAAITGHIEDPRQI